MQLSKENVINISSQKELLQFMEQNNIDLKKFSTMIVSDVFTEGKGVKENDKFSAYVLLAAIKNKNEFLIKELLNKDNILGTVSGFTPSSYSIDNEVRNTVTLKNLLNDKSFYQAYSPEELNVIFKIMDDSVYKPYGEDIRFKSVFQGEVFIKYGLPIILQGRCENLLQSMLIPLLSEFDKTATSIMKSNALSDIEFLFATIKKNKKELYEKNVEAGSSYDKNKINTLLKDGYSALRSFLNPETLYETLSSTTKKNQGETVKKIDSLLLLCDKLSSQAKGNIIFESEENALRLEKDNIKSHSKLKNTPVALAIDKSFDDVLTMFKKHGYEINAIEKRYIELKESYIEKNSSSEKMNQFIAISHEKGKTAYKKWIKFFEDLSIDEKEKLFQDIYNVTIEKEKASPSYYSIDVSEKTIRQDSEKYSLVSYIILNNSIEMILHLLDNGYKLSPSEYGLMVIPLSKLNIMPLDAENLPVELVSHKLVNHLKDYPEFHKRIFMDNVCSREIEKVKRSKSTNRFMDFYTYDILKNDTLNLSAREKDIVSFRLKNKMLPPMIMSHFLENEEHYNLLRNKTISWDDYYSKFKISVLLSLPFLKIPEVKDDFLSKIESIISVTEEIYPEVRSNLVNSTDEQIKKIYANSIAKKEKNLIMNSLSESVDKNNNKRRL